MAELSRQRRRVVAAGATAILFILGCGTSSSATPRPTVSMATIVPIATQTSAPTVRPTSTRQPTYTPVPTLSAEFEAEASAFLTQIEEHFQQADALMAATKPDVLRLFSGEIEDRETMRTRAKAVSDAWLEVQVWLGDEVSDDPVIVDGLNAYQAAAFWYDSAYLSVLEYIDGNEYAELSYRESMDTAALRRNQGWNALSGQ